MSTSRIHAAIVALTAACVADATLVGRGTYVSDGAPVSADAASEVLVIGGSPVETDTLAGEGTQSWRSDGGTSAARDGEESILCYVAAATGDVDVATTRAAAFAVLAAVESLLRANYTLGLAGVLSVEVTRVSYQLEQYADGTRVVVPFTVTVRSVI